MVLFSPLGDRVLAKPMKYASLARLTLSLVSCNWSSGSSCKSCIECPGLQDLQLLPLLQLHDTRESVRRAKEAYFIGLANTLSPNGLNRTTDR